MHVVCICTCAAIYKISTGTPASRGRSATAGLVVRIPGVKIEDENASAILTVAGLKPKFHLIELVGNLVTDLVTNQESSRTSLRPPPTSPRTGRKTA